MKEKAPQNVVIKAVVYLKDDTFQPTCYIVHHSLNHNLPHDIVEIIIFLR